MHKDFDPTEPRGFYLNVSNDGDIQRATDALIEQGRQIVPVEYTGMTRIVVTDGRVAWEYVPIGQMPHY